MTVNPPACRKCGSPLTPAMKFCESCGTKIEALPSCPQCGAALAPGGKFCENCGIPVAPAAAPVMAAPAVPAAVIAPVIPAPEPAPAPEVTPPAEPPVEAAPAVPAAVIAPVIPAPEPAPAPEVTPPAEPPVEAAPAAKAEEKPVPAPGESLAPAPGQGTEPIPPEKVKEIPRKTVAKKPIPRKTMIITGVIVLALLGAAVYFVVLPLTTGPATPSQDRQTPIVTTIPVTSSATPSIPVVTTQGATVSLTPGPTQAPPSERVIVIDTERDPITSRITVTFRGGDGQYGVSQILVRLTRSDGTVVTKTFKPDTVGSGVTLQGTARTDRLEVTSYFYTGENYKIIDRIFEYKKRGG